MTNATEPEPAPAASNLRFGWWCLLVFLLLGLVLEALHGFKVAWYLDVSNDTRRLMLRLGHAHGTLLGLVNIAYGLTALHLAARGALVPRWAGPCLKAAAVLLPAGFLIGGLVIYGGDPNPATVLLTPLGGILLVVGVLLAARAASRARG